MGSVALQKHEEYPADSYRLFLIHDHLIFFLKVRNNDIWKLHQRAYKKYHARVRKGTMLKGKFEIWAREVEELRDQALEKYEGAETSERAAIIEELRRELNA